MLEHCDANEPSIFRRDSVYFLAALWCVAVQSIVVDYDKVLIGVDFVVKSERPACCTWNGKERQLIWSTSKGDVCTIPRDK